MRKILAIAFVAVLKEWLESEPAIGFKNAFEEMVSKHIMEDAVKENYCVSHYFCDANMAMDTAFERLTGNWIDWHNERKLDIWNAAWDKAKETDFMTRQHTPLEGQKLTNVFFRLGGKTEDISALFEEHGLYDLYENHSAEIALGSKELYAMASVNTFENVYAGIQKLIGEIKI